MLLYLENCAIVMLPLGHIGSYFVILLHLAMEVRPWLLFHGRAEKSMDLLHISVAEIAEENNLPRVLEK